MSERFYYVDEQKIVLTPSEQVVALLVSSEASKTEVLTALDRQNGQQSFVTNASEVIEQFNLVLLPTATDVTESSISASVATLMSEPLVERQLPVFQVPDGGQDEIMVLVPHFRVQFKAEVSEEDIEQFNTAHNAEVVAKNDLGHNSYLLCVSASSGSDALDLANAYHESELTAYAEPDWVFQMSKLEVTVDSMNHVEQMMDTFASNGLDLVGNDIAREEPQMDRLAPPVNDPHYPDQWALTKMKVPFAWGINRGRPSIKIAILDEGVQTSHPDLSAKIVTPYDAVDNNNNQEPNSWDGHGTACAGIAAAIANNSQGVAGVARECKIMPIRIAFSSRPGARWTTNASWIARGIRTAVARGADVLSNSWGGGPYSTAIRSAFQYARTHGRGGKGCVVMAATGNSNRRSVIYPARYPEVLACGASNEWDERKSTTSRDGEYWWGSNYGAELDFLAPGVHIYTTDNAGAGGYSTGDYFHRFNGTSSATPNASGVGALVLSVDPNLRQWEVRDILRLTARDLNGRGWDEEHGWGRLDALKALQAAARVWYQVRLRLEFLGSGQECYMRFQLFRLYNSGLNRVRVNGFNIVSYDPAGNEIDRFARDPNPGGIMLPGIAPGGGSGHDIRVQGVLLKAHGNRSRWSYRWRANWGYTYWRPSRPMTTPAEIVESDLTSVEAEHEEEFEITVNGPSEAEQNPNISVATPFAEIPHNGHTNVIETNGRPMTLTFNIK
ncbi:S8 family serine peptidase [Chloroflexi bacterium TSY]|nr:S8 family serine peptidase [Chloroflexi bacterium TSY]